MKDEGWWFQALRLFCFLTDRWMDICDCRVTFATEKKTFNQNCECCCQFSVFEATNRASYDAHLTNLVSATANFCFLGPLAELAKIVTSWNMTNSTNNLVQKFKVNPSSATANFLFFRYLWLSTLKIWQTVPITCCKNFGSIWTKFWVLRPIFCFWSN